jgi:hypothetical protein
MGRRSFLSRGLMRIEAEQDPRPSSKKDMIPFHVRDHFQTEDPFVEGPHAIKVFGIKTTFLKLKSFHGPKGHQEWSGPVASRTSLKDHLGSIRCPNS